MKDKNKFWDIALKIIPLIFVLITFVVAFFLFRNVTFEDIVNFTPENIWLSVIVLIGLYAVKSISVVIPLTIFFVSAGIMYGAVFGIIVSIIGLVVSFTVPYFIGRFSAGGLIDALVKKYPKIKKIQEISHKNDFFVAYVTRAVVFVPGDIVSLLHGANSLKYRQYLFGSLLGVFPEMVFQVMVGNYLGQDVSARMIVAFVVMIAVSAILSIIINRIINKKSV